jgi:Spectrin repeat.
VSREPLLHDGKLGETIAQVEDLIRKHEDFEKTMEAQEEKFSALQRVTMVSSRFARGCACVHTLYKGVPSECGKAHLSFIVSSYIHRWVK